MGFENMPEFKMKSQEELDVEKKARQERIDGLRAKIESGEASEDEKREVERADQLTAQSNIRKSFEE